MTDLNQYQIKKLRKAMLLLDTTYDLFRNANEFEKEDYQKLIKDKLLPEAQKLADCKLLYEGINF